jgi:hypothetical protein
MTLSGAALRPHDFSLVAFWRKARNNSKIKQNAGAGQRKTMTDTKTWAFSEDAPPAALSPPLQALWWLKKGKLAMGPEWRKAHDLCQTREGEHAYDLVHALVHWIEGDVSNAAYWYRRVGAKRAADIPTEWQRIAAELSH